MQGIYGSVIRTQLYLSTLNKGTTLANFKIFKKMKYFNSKTKMKLEKNLYIFVVQEIVSIDIRIKSVC